MDKPISLKGIKIRSYKDIKVCDISDLPVNAPWIFISGENGMGKTVFLQALVNGLCPIHTDMNIFLEHLDLQCGLVQIDTHFHNKFGRDNSLGSNGVFHNRVMNQLVCYGASRLQTLTESDQNETLRYNPGVSRLFGQHTFLKNIDFELVKWKLKSGFTEYSQKEKQSYENKLAFVKKLFIELLDLVDIQVDEKNDKVWYLEKGTNQSKLQKVNRSELGAGYRILIAFVGDMILNLNAQQPDILDPKDLVGIVVIDELELHLHPKWQKQLPKVLTKYFPRVQFVASTHSPIPILGAPLGSVILKVDRTSSNGIEISRLKKLEKEIHTLHPNLLLSSDVFDFNNFDTKNGIDINQYRYEDKYEDIEINDTVREDLKELKDNSIFPDDLFEDE